MARAPTQLQALARRLGTAAPRARRVLTVLAVVVATVGGGTAALAVHDRTARLSVGEIRMSLSPGHRGALDLYVPLVDWGVRYAAIRLPARLEVDLRTVDRDAARRVAEAGRLDAHEVQAEARDALAGYLRGSILIAVLAGALTGLLVALAVRSRNGPRLRWTASLAAGTAVAGGILLVVLLPPRGALDRPQYYAFGPDIPRALSVLSDAQRSAGVLDQELDAQLVGLARLVVDPARRTSLGGARRLTVASDLHNNVLALPILGRITDGGPLLFAGDLTDRGSPLESNLLERVVHLGRPFVFVTGNHDSDLLARALARRGALVLGRFGPLGRDGRPRPGSRRDPTVEVGGVRVAGYGDPFVRLRSEGYRDRYDDGGPSAEDQQAFADWLRPLRGRVDVVMVHEPAMLGIALRELEADPPRRPLVFVVGHTHAAELDRPGDRVTVLNGGSVGAGGTGNLAGDPTAVGIARLLYDAGRRERFRPLAADLVSVDPGTGSSTARRERLDVPVERDDDAPAATTATAPAPAPGER
ncbi:metallophosphoesterase [Patulibacter brassicae]|uniref:Metallophosphoesterase n=1 Tax=Patulibacter brassicae TaxID=1705717 RepID=A0ABU4VRW7_9ACTN|nr:metallophosphoesterase [Patulibacter brassicae]MDX8153545.1 metallophosphoesterase [Patulibacter brassicae]